MFWRSPFAASDHPPGPWRWRGCREVLQEHWLTAFISHTVSKWKCGVPDYSLRTHEDVFICIAICAPQIKSFLSFSLFLARCAHFVIVLFGFRGMSAWTILVLWRRLPITEHIRQEKSFVFVSTCNPSPLAGNRMMCPQGMKLQSIKSIKFYMYRPGLQRIIASWGFTLSTNVDRWNLDVGEEKLQKSFTGKKKRRNLRHRSDPSFLDG